MKKLMVLPICALLSGTISAFEIVDTETSLYFFMDADTVYQGKCPDINSLSVLSRKNCFSDLKEGACTFKRPDIEKFMTERFSNDLTAAQKSFAELSAKAMETDDRVVKLKNLISDTTELISANNGIQNNLEGDISRKNGVLSSHNQILVEQKEVLTKIDEAIEEHGDSELILQKKEHSQKVIEKIEAEIVVFTMELNTLKASLEKVKNETAGYKTAVGEAQSKLEVIKKDYTPPQDHPMALEVQAAKTEIQHLARIWGQSGYGKLKRYLEYDGIPMRTEFFLPEDAQDSKDINDALEVFKLYFLPAVAGCRKST